jgi:hypothetical protein
LRIVHSAASVEGDRGHVDARADGSDQRDGLTPANSVRH